MFPRNKTELVAAFIILALALAWAFAVSLYGPELFQAIDSAFPRE